MNTMSVLDGLMRRYEVDQSNRDSSAATVYDGQWSAEEKEKTVEGYQQKLLFLIGQIVSILYVSYCSRYDYYIDRNFAQSLKNDEILREDNAPMYEKQRQHEFDPLEYLIKYDAGTHLAYLFHDISASSYEKQNVKEYEIAILHYEYLLSSKFLTHRRGKWYIRLCICYSHLKLFQCAIRAALRGLLDTFVVVSITTLIVIN